MIKKYFCYCTDHGFETFNTEDEAKKSAQESIDVFRDYAKDGWDENVDQICWGEIKQQTVIIDKKTIEEAAKDKLINSKTIASCWIDYGLVDIKE